MVQNPPTQVQRPSHSRLNSSAFVHSLGTPVRYHTQPWLDTNASPNDEQSTDRDSSRDDSLYGSGPDDEDSLYTPLTTPCTSPIKSSPLFETSTPGYLQCDGAFSEIEGEDEPAKTHADSSAATSLFPREECSPHEAAQDTPRKVARKLGSPDRFIANRSSPPSKDCLFLPRARERLTPSDKGLQRQGFLNDPFGPELRNSYRMTERRVAMRDPQTLLRPIRRNLTSILDSSRRVTAPNSI